LQSPKNNPAGSPRCIIVGSITGNTNTLAGNVPPKADLGDLRGLNAGLDGRNSSMINGGDFDGAKAYKDSKVGGRSGARGGSAGVSVERRLPDSAKQVTQ